MVLGHGLGRLGIEFGSDVVPTASSVCLLVPKPKPRSIFSPKGPKAKPPILKAEQWQQLLLKTPYSPKLYPKALNPEAINQW